MSKKFDKWLEEQDRRELAMEFLWYEAGIDTDLNYRRISSEMQEKERFIKDSLLERIVNGSLFEPQFDQFLRERWEGHNAD